jgi:hypothetical protein
MQAKKFKQLQAIHTFMTEDSEIRQLVLSTEEEFPENDLPFVRNWLNTKRSASFKFRYRKPVGFPVGSIAVFLYEGRYVGSAVTSSEVLPISGDSVYTGEVSFEPNSIKIFQICPPRLNGLKFYRNLVRLTWSQYQGILGRTRGDL